MRKFILLLVALSLLTVRGMNAQMGVRQILRANDGTVRPAPGYVWNGDPQQNNFAVKVRDDLRVHHYDSNGLTSFVPAPGYVWAGDPNSLVTKVRRDLRLLRVNPNGSSTFVAAAGYEFVGNPNELVTRVRPDLRLGSDGLFYPGPGYVWAGDPNSLVTRVRPDLRLVRVDPNGLSTFLAAPGYEFVGNPNNLIVRLRHGYAAGRNGGVRPAPGYRWVDPYDEDSFAVRPHDGLVENTDGTLRPAAGLDWAAPENPNDFSVRPANGYVWASTETRDYAVRRSDRDVHPREGVAGTANRSPAFISHGAAGIPWAVERIHEIEQQENQKWAEYEAVVNGGKKNAPRPNASPSPNPGQRGNGGSAAGGNAGAANGTSGTGGRNTGGGPGDRVRTGDTKR